MHGHDHVHVVVRNRERQDFHPMLLRYALQDIPAEVFMSLVPKDFIAALCDEHKVERRYAILMAKAVHNFHVSLWMAWLAAQSANCAAPSFLFWKKETF